MGWNLDEQQIAALENARNNGTKVVVSIATNELLKQQVNVTDEQQMLIAEYARHGGQANLTSMLNYAAHEFAGKEVEVAPVREQPEFGLFHLGEKEFETVGEFEDYLAAERPGLSTDAPKVALLGAFLRPRDKFDRPQFDYFIKRFEQQGLRVYPIFGRGESINILQQVKPDLAIVFPHGRLARGNRMPQLLAEMDIPCLSALTIMEDYEDWVADERGMAGGMLSQSITMPELDGVIEPIAVAAHQANERGIQVKTPIEDRIDRFATRATNWLRLRQKPNSEKRLVIVYYKAPGMSAMTSAGLETAPSLWNLLQRLEGEGYDLGGRLPESPDALFDLIQSCGKTLGQWAIGSYERFLEDADPELIPAESYAEWFAHALSEKRQRDTIERWGSIPGQQMVTESDGKPHLVVSRIRMGNVVIMPQPTVGSGGADEDEIKSIHGTDRAPPHFYLAAYLWAQHGFQADAIVHFGTHGSLEFTYGKSVCLSRDCWPDILIGDLPHVYPYIVNNVGEGMVAKRRSYAVLTSHLTPPFTQSGLYGDLSLLHEKLHVLETEEDPLLKRETRRTVTQMVRDLDLARDLDLPKDAGAERLLTDEEIGKVDRLIHEISSKTITDGLHVLGRPFSDEQIRNTTLLMLGEPGYDTLLELTGRASHPEMIQERHELARRLVNGVLAGEITAEQFFDEAELVALREEQSKARTPEPSGRMEMVTTSGGESGDTAKLIKIANDLIQEAKSAGLLHSVLCGCPGCQAWVKANPDRVKAITQAMAAARGGKPQRSETQGPHGQSREHGKAHSHKDGGHVHSHKHGDNEHAHEHGNEHAHKQDAHEHGDEPHSHVHGDEQSHKHTDHAHTHKHDDKEHPHEHGDPLADPKDSHRSRQHDAGTPIHKGGHSRFPKNEDRSDTREPHSRERSDAPHTHAHSHDHGEGSSGHAPIDLTAFWGDASSRPEVVGSQEDKLAFLDLMDNIQRYADALRNSPGFELTHVVRALDGRYVSPSDGGDPLFNPESTPTGRNLYAISAVKTPSEEAWRVGRMLARQIIERHKGETGRYPRQVAFTLWGSEFIRSKGTTLAEIMYLIGVRPVYNSRGTVHDVELIPPDELGRPRIDVLVQTSGQFRDAGASRIELLDKAITMVAELPDETIPNFVRDGSAATEQELKKQGFAPKQAREFSTARIFGSAANQGYGTGIMGLVEKGDQWEDESQVADQYMRNMGGVYRNGKTWGTYYDGVMGAAMQGTELVIHPRSSNTWGPLSLDHVYEFMGGLTASIRHKTGKDPTGYFSDLRTRGRPKATTSVAAIREEARTTLWNPKFILGMQREGASAAGSLTETVRNMYGWNVMQPSAIDQQMWDETYRVFIEDKHDLEMRKYFEDKNPYALQDMTAVMLETARKGYWRPSEDVLQELARVHAELVAKFGAACSYETCGNQQLQEFLNGHLVAPGKQAPAELVDAYGASLAAALVSQQPIPEIAGLELEEKSELVEQVDQASGSTQTVPLACLVVLSVVAMLCIGVGDRGGALVRRSPSGDGK